MFIKLLTFLILFLTQLGYSQGIEELEESKARVEGQIILLKDSLGMIERAISKIEVGNFLEKIEKEGVQATVKSDVPLRKENSVTSEVYYNLKRGQVITILDYNTSRFLLYDSINIGWVSEMFIVQSRELDAFVQLKKNGFLENYKPSYEPKRTSNPSTEIKVQTTSPVSNRTQSNKSSSVRCSGTTTKGSRCKRMTKSSNGRCYQHGG